MRPRKLVRFQCGSGLLAACLLSSAARGQVADTSARARIRVEAMERSQVMSIARTLSDVYGPRLAGSKGYREAATWARDRMRTWGLANAALEPWGKRGRGWELERFSVEMTSPRYLRITAIPKAWSRSIVGTIRGAPVRIDVRADSDFARYTGKLRGKIVLAGSATPPDRDENPVHRLTDSELDSMARLTDPGSPKTYWEDFDEWIQIMERREKILAFFRREGVAAILEPSPVPAVRAQAFNAYATDRSKDIPAFIVAPEHYSQIQHLLEAGRPVQLALSLTTRYTQTDTLGYNVVAELPGTDPTLAPQLVMLGGHFDSWHAGTGATDNAAGCAVAMEVMRVLKTINARPRRTIRIALWDGEEQEDYFGSMGYVKKHFGDPYTMQLKSEHALLSAYYNLDNGTGKIRGIYARGNDAARRVFQDMFTQFADLGASTVTLANTGSTDHMPFTSVGLPAFELIQDPIDYETRTHYTSLDVADYLLEADLKQAVVVLASVVYETAMRDEMIPRLPLPAHRPAPK